MTLELNVATPPTCSVPETLAKPVIDVLPAASVVVVVAPREAVLVLKTRAENVSPATPVEVELNVTVMPFDRVVPDVVDTARPVSIAVVSALPLPQLNVVAEVNFIHTSPPLVPV